MRRLSPRSWGASTVHHLPCPVGLAAGGAIGFFSATANRHDRLILPAILAGIRLIGAQRRHRIAIAAMRIFPIDALVGGHIFEHVAHAGLIIGIDHMTNEAAKHGTDERAAHHRPGAPALVRADDAAEHGADCRAYGIAVAGGVAVAIAVIIIAIDGVISGVGAAVIIVAIAHHRLHIDRLRDHHHMVDVPIDDHRPRAMRLVVAVIAIPGTILIDRLVGPLIRRLMAGLTAVSIAMVRAVFGMALRRGLLLIAMVLLLPVGMLLRRALALPLGFLLLLMLAANAVILFGALTLGMALLIDLALTALLLLVLTLTLTLRLLLVSLLLCLLVALALLPLTLPLRIYPFLPDMLVTLALSGLFLLARLMLALGLPLLGDTLLHMLVARSFGAMVL